MKENAMKYPMILFIEGRFTVIGKIASYPNLLKNGRVPETWHSD